MTPTKHTAPETGTPGAGKRNELLYDEETVARGGGEVKPGRPLREVLGGRCPLAWSEYGDCTDDCDAATRKARGCPYGTRMQEPSKVCTYGGPAHLPLERHDEGRGDK